MEERRDRIGSAGPGWPDADPVAAMRPEQDDCGGLRDVSVTLEVGEFLQRVDIVKRALIGKGDFNRPVARVPRAHLAFTRVQKSCEVVGQTRAQQREDRVNRRQSVRVGGGDGGDINLV
jgi:hypothetical protein